MLCEVLCAVFALSPRGDPALPGSKLRAAHIPTLAIVGRDAPSPTGEQHLQPTEHCTCASARTCETPSLARLLARTRRSRAPAYSCCACRMACSVTSPCRSRRRRGPSACSRTRYNTGHTVTARPCCMNENIALFLRRQKQAQQVCRLACLAASLCRCKPGGPACRTSAADSAWSGAKRPQLFGHTCCMIALV